VATPAGAAVSGDAAPLPDYPPVPPSALGPAVNAQGYYVGRVERDLYRVTDGTYQAAFPDVYTASTAFVILESVRLDQGFGSQIHP
jgi:hypothetical protein